MLACDIIIQTRASGSLSAEQVAQLERLVFGAGKPDRDQLDLLFLIDAYVRRADASWGALLARAVEAAGEAHQTCAGTAPVELAVALQSARKLPARAA